MDNVNFIAQIGIFNQNYLLSTKILFSGLIGQFMFYIVRIILFRKTFLSYLYSIEIYIKQLRQRLGRKLSNRNSFEFS